MTNICFARCQYKSDTQEYSERTTFESDASSLYSEKRTA